MMSTFTVGLATVPVANLRPHPQNPAIYGDKADQQLIDSIREQGITQRLLVTTDGIIISGHRRWDAAKQLGLATVNVEISPLTDDLDILAALIHSNIGARVKTNEQLAREAAALMEIERERARRRQLTGLKYQPIVPAVTAGTINQDRDTPTGEAAVRVGERLGIGQTKVKRAEHIARALDSLDAAGKSTEAGELRQALNDGSVEEAYSLGRGRGWLGLTQRPRSAPKVVPAAPADDDDQEEWVITPEMREHERRYSETCNRLYAASRELPILIASYSGDVNLEDIDDDDQQRFIADVERLEGAISVLQKRLTKLAPHLKQSMAEPARRSPREWVAKAVETRRARQAERGDGQNDQQTVLDALRQLGPSTNGELCTATGFDHKRVGAHLFRLIQAGAASRMDERRQLETGRTVVVYTPA